MNRFSILIVAIITVLILSTAALAVEELPKTTETAAVTDNTTAAVAKKALDMIDDLASVISGQLKTKSPMVWAMFVKQNFAEGIVTVVINLLLLAGALIGFVLSVKNDNKIYTEKKDPGESSGLTIALFIVAVVVAIICLFSLPGGILRIVNPEYYGAKELLQIIGNPKSVL